MVVWCLRTPNAPIPPEVTIAFLHNGDVEGGSKIPPEHRALRMFDLIGLCLARRFVLFIGLGYSQQKHPGQGLHQQGLHRLAPQIITFPLDPPDLDIRHHDHGQPERSSLVKPLVLVLHPFLVAAGRSWVHAPALERPFFNVALLSWER